MKFPRFLFGLEQNQDGYDHSLNRSIALREYDLDKKEECRWSKALSIPLIPIPYLNHTHVGESSNE